MAGPPADRPPASETLQRLGFTPFETVNLLELKRRYERGALGDTLPAQRLRFAQWLVRVGRLTEGQVEASPRTDPDGPRTIDDPLPSGRSEDPLAVPNALRPTAMATAVRCNVRVSRLDSRDEPIPLSGPSAPVESVRTRNRLVTGVFAAVIMLSVLGVFGAYALMAAFGT